MILETFDTCNIYMPYTVYCKLAIKTLPFPTSNKVSFGTRDMGAASTARPSDRGAASGSQITRTSPLCSDSPFGP